jgi:hypothetical protein
MRRVLPFLLLLLFPVKSSAQFYGAAGLGVTSSSNVSGLDSNVPDVILDPNLLLGYDWNIDHRFRLGLSGGVSTSQYTSNTDRSSSNIFFGVTPTYYLLSKGTFFATVTNKDTESVEVSTMVGSVSDRLLKLENWLIAVRPKLPKLRSTIDSSQELIGVTRELLSTTAYTTSVKEIVLSELRDQLRAIESHRSKELANITKEWKALIAKLESIEEESDFLPTDELDLESEEEEETESALTPSAQLAPLTTLSTTYQRFRNLGASDFYLLQDRGVISERTIATAISLPVSWSKQTNSAAYENYSNEQLWLSLRASGLPSEILQLAGSIDRIGTEHPLDSVYSNTEWRVRGTGKLVLNESSILGGEFGYGLRDYSNPLSFAVNGGPGGRTLVTVGSSFSQFNVGLWYQHFLSEKLAMGGVIAAAISPDLKAYVTSIDRTFNQQGPPDGSLGVADEEYNYDLLSITGFLNSNPIEEIEATLDLSYQRRSYGAVDLGTVRNQAGNKEIQDLIASASAAQRTESWVTASIAASRLFLFDNRLLSVFSGIGVEAAISHTSVSASVSTYSNDNTSFSLSASAYF